MKMCKLRKSAILTNGSIGKQVERGRRPSGALRIYFCTRFNLPINPVLSPNFLHFIHFLNFRPRSACSMSRLLFFSDTYTGIWIFVKYGYIAIGILDEHTLNNPMLQWKDSRTPYNVGVLGLTSEGSAVFYGVDCPLIYKVTFYPSNTCTKDLDCESIPNTRCIREPEPLTLPGTTFRLLTCDCNDGFEPIPKPFRMIEGGCYDPIVKTVTVNARCLSDRHCQFLKNTECIPSYQDSSIKTCRCKKGTLPLTRLKDTGM